MSQQQHQQEQEQATSGLEVDNMADSKKLVKLLPEEYQEVEYIQTDGNGEYIDTNYVPTANTKIKIDFVFLGSSSTESSSISLLGERISSGFTGDTKFAFWVNKDTNRIAINYGTYDSGYTSSGITNASIRNVTSNVLSNLYYNDSFVTGDDSATFGSANLSIYLFAIHETNGMVYRNIQAKVYNMKIYENDMLVRNLIPCYRISDNVIGMYDTVNDVFYTNSGTGSFSKGNDINTWLHSLRKLATATDTITTLPADLYADGQNASADIIGNMQQTGTPTPQNPIQPQETGDLETEGAKAGQYKIPISSASTTTPIYLGEVQTERKIKKLVFNGTENWQKATNFLYLSGLSQSATSDCICSHYKGVASGANYTCTMVGNIIRVYDSSYSTAEDFKTYLATQYTAGTPVTVWYVLANSTTGILNEPLRKIGTYADTVSGITIPTITGKDTFDVQTTLKPSEVEMAYTGWHDATVKEWDGSEWQ